MSMTMWPILIFDSDSNDVVSSSIGNVGPVEPSANEFKSTPGLENSGFDEVKSIPGPETLDAHSNSLKCDSTITSLVDKHVAYEKRGDGSARLTEDETAQIDLLSILQHAQAPLYYDDIMREYHFSSDKISRKLCNRAAHSGIG